MDRSPFPLVALALVLAACRQAETPEQAAARARAEADSARATIDAINARYNAFINARQSDSIVALFTDDAVEMPPNQPALAGREAIRTWAPTNVLPPNATYAFQTTALSVSGPIAVERGTYAITMPGQGRQAGWTMSGKYLTHWHRVNGQWLIAAEIWSDDMAAGN